jgi:alpha-tubulin suppressor-like RCC1 family protein
MCGNKEYKDLEEPTPFKELDMINIKDVACCYKYCIALNDKGEMFYWGSYLHGKHKKYLQNEEVKV